MTIKYFIGTLEINRGGGYYEQTCLFTCYQTRPRNKLWDITQQWFPNVSEVDERNKLVYFDDWHIIARPSLWLEVDLKMYRKLKQIIQEM